MSEARDRTMDTRRDEGTMSNERRPSSGLMTEHQAAAYTGHSVSAYRKWRYTGEGPRYAKLGASVRYRKRDLDEWIEANLVESTSEQAAG